MITRRAAQACGYQGQHHYTLAAILEFIHTATLLHDDVVDESNMRRGRETANAMFGNAASVLVGEFLYSRAFEMMIDVDSMKVMQILAENGLIGLLAGGTLLIAVAWAGWQRWRAADVSERHFLAGIVGALAATAVHCLFDTPPAVPINALVIAVWAAILTRNSASHQPQRGAAGVANCVVLLVEENCLILLKGLISEL